VVLTHNPDVFPRVPARAVLTLAGHTHGGQVALPILGRPVVPSRFGQRYAIGHIEEEGRDLFVTPGIGTSIIPVRFGVPPEISLLTLARAAATRRAPSVARGAPGGRGSGVPSSRARAASARTSPTPRARWGRPRAGARSRGGCLPPRARARSCGGGRSRPAPRAPRASPAGRAWGRWR